LLLSKEHVPEQVNIAYGATKPSLTHYIIHLPFDPRLITAVAPAVAKPQWTGVALNPITDWSKYEEELMTDWVTIIRWFG
jgi:malate dehydrogenase (oxaloacetate-decarboxylating)(NADP+)